MKLTKKQEYELLASISGRGEISVKFAYLGEGTRRWDEIYNHWTGAKDVTGEEISLLLTYLDSFVKVFEGAEGVNLIDLGCGNGIPAIHILKHLADRRLPTHYVAVDISEEMLDLAKQNIMHKFPELDIIPLLLDFEKDSLTNSLLDLKQGNGYPNFMINLGNTLGNYVNTSGVLTNFMECMTLNDYLLLGNGLANDYNPQKIIDAYNIEIIIDLVTAPAKSLGIYNSSDDFKYLWNANKNRLEGRIKLNEDKKLTLAGQEVLLAQGEEILVHSSNKYSESSLTKLLSDVGFRTELLTTTKGRGHILTMVQPTRYSVA